jgi:hypothetical protein
LKKNLSVWAAILAMGLGTISAAAADSSKLVKHPAAKKTHVVHHTSSAKSSHAKTLHASKPAVSHKAASSKSHKALAKKTVAKSHAKGLSRLQKRRA